VGKEGKEGKGKQADTEEGKGVSDSRGEDSDGGEWVME
jgi:hypothetical protein